MRFAILAAGAALGMSAPGLAATTITVNVQDDNGHPVETIAALTAQQFAALDHVGVVSTFLSGSGTNFSAFAVGAPAVVRVTTMGGLTDPFFFENASTYIDYALAAGTGASITSPSLNEVRNRTLSGSSLSIFQNAIQYISGAPVDSSCRFLSGIGPCNAIGYRPDGTARATVTYYFNEQVPGAVPEPATWAMMLVGFGGVGVAMRRRKKVTARVAYAV